MSFLDKEVLHVGGRLHNALVSYDAKFPILSPSTGRFNELVVLSEHYKTIHSGLHGTIVNIWHYFWTQKFALSVVNFSKDVHHIGKSCGRPTINGFMRRFKRTDCLMPPLPMLQELILLVLCPSVAINHNTKCIFVYSPVLLLELSISNSYKIFPQYNIHARILTICLKTISTSGNDFRQWINIFVHFK